MQTGKAGTVSAYNAKTHFSELLGRAAAGEEITITRHGTPVAKLVPVQKVPSVESRRDAIEKMRQLAAKNRLDGLSIKELVAEGRK